MYSLINNSCHQALQLEARLLNRVECCCFPQGGCAVGVVCCTLHYHAAAAVFRIQVSDELLIRLYS